MLDGHNYAKLNIQYDFEANLKRMNFEDFKILCQQSTMVNNTMAQFIDKLSKVRKDPIDPFAF